MMAGNQPITIESTDQTHQPEAGLYSYQANWGLLFVTTTQSKQLRSVTGQWARCDYLDYTQRSGFTTVHYKCYSALQVSFSIMMTVVHMTVAAYI